MPIKVAIENNIEGRSLAWVLDTPGCFAYGSEEAEALIRVPQALIAFKGWLDGWAEDSWLKDLGDFDIRLIETFRAYKVNDSLQPDEAGDLEINAWFHHDWLPLSTLEFERGLQVVGWAHQDLHELTASLSAEQLERTFEGERWSIQGILGHIGTAEWWYLSRLGLAKFECKALPVDAFDRMQFTLANLAAVRPEMVDREFVQGIAGEIWSPRKIIRRFCWHALDHCQHIHKLITQM
jgi:uncharacterized damage-inducible protein DinB